MLRDSTFPQQCDVKAGDGELYFVESCGLWKNCINLRFQIVTRELLLRYLLFLLSLRTSLPGFYECSSGDTVDGAPPFLYFKGADATDSLDQVSEKMECFRFTLYSSFAKAAYREYHLVEQVMIQC